MRLSLAAAGLAISVALLAGCSSSSQGTLPTGASQGATQHVGGGAATIQVLPKVMTRDQVAKLHPSVLPNQVLEAALHRPQSLTHITVDKSAKPTMVLTDNRGYIWWLSKRGKITGYATDCKGPEGGVIDHHGRLIVACTSASTVNIYNKGNTTGPADVVLSDTTGYFPGDAFEDKNGNIFASNLYGFSCGPSTCNSYSGNIVWWTTNNQSTGSSPSGSYTDPNLYQDYFADVDANGNVYVDGLVCTNPSGYCYTAVPEVDTVTGIMGSAPSASNDNISMTFPGGIYALGNGQISVLDQGCSDIGCGSDALYLYASLPGTPASTLYPPQSFQDGCDPISAGYNKADSEVLIGDAGCRAGDLGNVSTKTWKNILNINFGVPVAGAFLKSDK